VSVERNKKSQALHLSLFEFDRNFVDSCVSALLLSRCSPHANVSSEFFFIFLGSDARTDSSGG
jgi:hypothetical protein